MGIVVRRPRCCFASCRIDVNSSRKTICRRTPRLRGSHIQPRVNTRGADRTDTLRATRSLSSFGGFLNRRAESTARQGRFLPADQERNPAGGNRPFSPVLVAQDLRKRLESCGLSLANESCESGEWNSFQHVGIGHRDAVGLRRSSLTHPTKPQNGRRAIRLD